MSPRLPLPRPALPTRSSLALARHEQLARPLHQLTGRRADSASSSYVIEANQPLSQKSLTGTGYDDFGHAFGFYFGCWGVSWLGASVAPSQLAIRALLGARVTIFEDTIVAGANANSDRGPAYLLERRGESWHETVALSISHTNDDDRFDESVTLNADILVGANEDRSPAGVGTYYEAVAAYVHARSGDDWIPRALLRPSSADMEDNLDSKSPSMVTPSLVGAHLESSTTRSIDGDMLDNLAESAGAVYVFTGL